MSYRKLSWLWRVVTTVVFVQTALTAACSRPKDNQQKTAASQVIQAPCACVEAPQSAKVAAAAAGVDTSLKSGDEVFGVAAEVVLEVQYISAEVRYSAYRFTAQEPFTVLYQTKAGVFHRAKAGKQLERLLKFLEGVRVTSVEPSANLNQAGVLDARESLTVRSAGTLDPFWLPLGQKPTAQTQYALLPHAHLVTISSAAIDDIKRGLLD